MIVLRPYAALFMNGARQSITDIPAVISSLAIYTTLMAIWMQIFRLIPMQDIGLPGINYHHFIWYMAITEGVIISGPGLFRFGALIGEGRVTELMQRPISMSGMVIARLLGQQCGMAAIIIPLVAAVLSVVAPISFDMLLLPQLIISFVMSAILYQVFCYLVGMIEILGPYSRPMSWIVGKFIFSFGGLFFPVLLFPEWLQKIVWMTPFPATIYVPASVVLVQDAGWMLQGIAIQFGWIVALLAVVMVAENRMLRRVMRMGD